MKELIIEGNRELNGNIKIEGAKNSLVAILPAAILTKSIVKLENITPIKDTYSLIAILEKLNVRVIYDNISKMIIDARNVKNVCLDCIEMTRIRASYYFMGALLGLYKEVSVLGPGGCRFASRPIDLHLEAFNKLGVDYRVNEGIYNFKKGKVRERIIKFNKVSVGATINTILISTRMRGNIRLINVSKEPEVDDLINFLNKCGANIKREENTIIVKGNSNLFGCEYKIIEDRIEAGTYLIIGACVGKNLKIEYSQSRHLQSLIDLLVKIGVDLKVKDNYILVNKSESIVDINVVCDIYPFIATDLQQPLSILLARCNNLCILEDRVYPSRYTQIEDLNKMGFKMEVKNDCLYVRKSEEIYGEVVTCKDLRGGASLVVAALIAKGSTRIKEVKHIERGYYNLVNKLNKVGAKIHEEN